MKKENKNLLQELTEVLDKSDCGTILSAYRERVEKGALTKQENPESHFCVYFAAYDRKNKQVFLGHHKKSGLWLFNGGHIDKGENISETVVREIDEEWGLNADNLDIKGPSLLTITEIENPAKQICREHYDIWHFVSVDKDSFDPDTDKVLEEFHQAKWVNLTDARELVKCKHTLTGIDFIEKHYF